MTIEKKLKHYIERITHAMNVDLIILFGSHARGNTHEYSDIDLAVISNELNPKAARWENIKLIKEKANLHFDPDLQLIPFSREAFQNEKDSPIESFIREIKRTGIIVYEKQIH